MGQHWRNISPLEKHQSKGQDGFRRYRGVEDTENVCSKFLEWNFPVWFASFALTAFKVKVKPARQWRARFRAQAQM